MSAVDEFHCAAIRHWDLHWKVPLVVVSKYYEAEINLLEVVQALATFARPVTNMCGKQHCGKNSDHKNHCQQFNKRERFDLRFGGRRFHGFQQANSSRRRRQADLFSIVSIRGTS